MSFGFFLEAAVKIGSSSVGTVYKLTVQYTVFKNPIMADKWHMSVLNEN